MIVAGPSDWGCVLIPTGLPAELIPHKIQEANLLDGVFCWELIVAGPSDWGCVLIPTGLPAELIPQMFVPCLTTGVIIPALCRIVNHFRKIFPRKLKKSKIKPPHRTFSPSVQERFLRHAGAGRVLFSDIGPPAFFFQEHRSIIPSFLQANAIISMELHFRC